MQRFLPPPASRWRDVIVLTVLFLLPLLVFLPVALVRSTFYVHDVQHYFYPYHVVTARILAQGQLPLWNPYAFSGIPLLGDGQTAMFYPPNWLFFLVSGVAALNYAVLLEFSIAGMGSYLFARSLGLWRVSAFVAAVSFMFCGFLTARVVHLSILSSAALLPLLFFCVERALHTGAPRWFAAAALAVALQVFAGHPQVPVYTALALLVYTLVRAVARGVRVGDWHALWRMPLRLAGMYALGFCVAAIQLVPWVELAAQSPRAAGTSFDFVFGSSMAASNWLLFLFPYLYGSLASSIYASQPMDIATSVKTWEHSAYVGMLPLALALVALMSVFKARSKQQTELRDHPSGRWTLVFFALLLLLGLLMAAGKYTPLSYLIYATPVLGKLRDVERAIVLAAWALAMLAGFGMQRLVELANEPVSLTEFRAEDSEDHIEEKKNVRLALAIPAVIIGLLPILVWLVTRLAFVQAALALTTGDMTNLQLAHPNTWIPIVLGLASMALLLWCSRRPVTIGVVALAVALVLLDMGSYAAIFNPTTDAQLYSYQPESVAFLRHDRHAYRVATWITNNAPENRAAQEQLAVSWGMVYDIQTINGFNSLQPRRYTDYLFGPDVPDVSYGYLASPRLLQPDNPVLSSLNVKYLIVPTTDFPPLGSNFQEVFSNHYVRIYQNTAVYPRAFFADRVQLMSDTQSILNAVTAPGFDGRQVSIVEAIGLPELVQSSGEPAQVKITSYEANQIELITVTSEPRFLVLSEMYFSGWHAYVDGEETPLYRTNYLFRGVIVPPGQHVVEFRYRPWSAIIGTVVSIVALIVVVVLVLWRRGSTTGQPIEREFLTPLPAQQDEGNSET